MTADQQKHKRLAGIRGRQQNLEELKPRCVEMDLEHLLFLCLVFSIVCVNGSMEAIS